MLTATYNPWLVTLSVIIAVIVSYTSLSLAERVSSSTRHNANYWLAGGAISMGIGIWSMHFIAMMAFSLPIPVAYDITLTMVSVIPAIIASGIALFEIRRRKKRLKTLLFSGFAMGAGISIMHYTGMASMRMSPPIIYDPFLFVLSIMIAIGASIAALEIAFYLKTETASRYISRKAGGALVMGLAIAGMHYTAMAAANFPVGSVCLASPRGNPTWLAISISVAIFTLLVITQIVSAYDVRLAAQNRKLVAALSKASAESQALFETVIDQAPIPMVIVRATGEATFNPASLDHFGIAGDPDFIQGVNFFEMKPTWQTCDIKGNPMDFDELPLSQALRGKTTNSIGVRIVRHDGSERWGIVSAAPIFNGEGDLIAGFGSCPDVTEQKQAEMALRENEGLQRDLLNNTSSVIYIKDKDGRYLFINKMFEKLFHISDQEVKGKSDHDIFPKATADAFRINDLNAIEKDTTLEFEETVYQDDGEHTYISVKVPLKNVAGEIYAVCGISTDITARKRAERKIRTLSQAIEQSPVSVVIAAPNGRIEYVNSTFEKVTGYSASEVIGQNPRTSKFRNDPDCCFTDLWKVYSSGVAWQGESQSRRKNGDIFWERAHISPVLDESGSISHFLAVKEDITLRKEQEERLQHQAHFDALTDLPNRFLALDRLAQLLSKAQRSGELVAVLYLDMDDFKKINDTLGHETGDKLLIEVAERLSSIVRSADTVGRLGGDEFIILLGGLTKAIDVRPVVENLLEQFRDVFRLDGRELILTVSVGIALYPDDGDNSSELLRNADSAMYHSKELGRNTYCYFTEAMNRDASRRLLLEEQMHGALDRGEFSLCYQPQVNVVDGHITGVEALLRWHNSALGEVTPTEFIPVAEQTGLIVPIGQFVLTEALTMAARWQEKRVWPFTMAVNLSPRQFRDPNLVTFIESAIHDSGVSAEFLELEITEGVLMSGHAYIDDALVALSDMGVSIAMDDFGTGYSSLNYLRSYPFDILKIDRSFVENITVDASDLKLVNSTISMAHSLGLKVVAEGVEKKEQLVLLAAQGCDVAQGYLFSKPVSNDKIAAMLKAGSIEER